MYQSSQKKKVPVPQPFTVAQYNKFMGGTDRMDRSIADTRTAIRMKKWWFCIFAWLLDVTVHNAWLLYRDAGKNKSTLMEFRQSVALFYLKTIKSSFRNPVLIAFTISQLDMDHN